MVLIKRFLLFSLIVSCLVLSTSCVQAKQEEQASGSEPEGQSYNMASKSEEQEPTTESEFAQVIPGYEELVRKGAPFEHGIIWEKNIVWLSFSATEYEEERGTIREYIEDEIVSAKEFTSRPDFEPIIAICKYDIDNDHKDEVIAFIGGSSFWGGAHSSGVFRVFYFDNDAIVSEIWLPSFPVDIETLGDSHQFGIIARNEGTCDIFIRNRLFIWNGDSWG